MSRAHRRARGDRGAALVEAAIVLPFIALMVFGIVELGFLFRSGSVAVSATRSGARLMSANYGSALNATQQSTVLANVKAAVESELQSKATVDTPVEMWIYKAASDGTPTGGANCASDCVKYATWNSGSATFTTSSGSIASVVACGTSKDRVGVYLKMNHAPLGFTGFLGTLTITEKAVMVIEPPNPNTCPSGS